MILVIYIFWAAPLSFTNEAQRE